MTQQVKVFVSSTCFDLADARQELRRYLEENQFLVSLSEDFHSAFYVDPLDDSIGTCLQNVKSSDVVVCLIDRRYGGKLKEAPYGGISATHAELRHAWEHKTPVFTFIRNTAWLDYQQLKMNPDYSSKWVEPDKDGIRVAWVEFVSEIVQHNPSTDRSNFRDLFEFSTDLKPLVLKRLIDHFPKHAGTLAMRPDRLARLHFVYCKCAPDGTVVGHFRNVGVGPAMNIYHGVTIDGRDVKIHSRGALGEQENVNEPERKDFRYMIEPNKQPVLFCEYENRFGDCYRVEQPLLMTEKGYEPSGSDKFTFVPPHLRISAKDGK